MFSKKICCIIIALSFIFMLIPASVSAESPIYVAVTPPESASQGKTIQVEVNMSGAEKDIYAFGVVSVQFDSNALEYVSAKKGDKVSSAMSYQFNLSGSSVEILAYSSDSEAHIPQKTWTLATLTFKVKDTAALGNVSFSIASTEGFSGSDTAQIPSIATEAKTMKIVEKPSSDANLSALSVKGYPFNTNFSPSKTTGYSITVPFDVTAVDVEYNLNDAQAKASVRGNKNLDVGNNNIYVTVVAADDETQKTYRITVVREPDPNAPIVSESTDDISSDITYLEDTSSSQAQIYDDSYDDPYQSFEKKYKQLQEKLIVIIIAFSMVVVAMAAYIIYLLMQRNR